MDIIGISVFKPKNQTKLFVDSDAHKACIITFEFFKMI